jgi:hypothetical protein
VIGVQLYRLGGQSMPLNPLSKYPRLQNKASKAPSRRLTKQQSSLLRSMRLKCVGGLIGHGDPITGRVAPPFGEGRWLLTSVCRGAGENTHRGRRRSFSR